jgi:hypothetical protein
MHCIRSRGATTMAQASSPPGAPHDFTCVMGAEKKYTNAWRQRTGRSEGAAVTGLALSGGGIRSAVFCLGVLQALAKHDLLKRFDYLSTVSGGGYIGSSLTWFTSRPITKPGQTPYGVGPGSFPYGVDDPKNSPNKKIISALKLRRVVVFERVD